MSLRDQEKYQGLFTIPPGHTGKVFIPGQDPGPRKPRRYVSNGLGRLPNPTDKKGKGKGYNNNDYDNNEKAANRKRIEQLEKQIASLTKNPPNLPQMAAGLPLPVGRQPPVAGTDTGNTAGSEPSRQALLKEQLKKLNSLDDSVVPDRQVIIDRVRQELRDLQDRELAEQPIAQQLSRAEGNVSKCRKAKDNIEKQQDDAKKQLQLWQSHIDDLADQHSRASQDLEAARNKLDKIVQQERITDAPHAFNIGQDLQAMADAVHIATNKGDLQAQLADMFQRAVVRIAFGAQAAVKQAIETGEAPGNILDCLAAQDADMEEHFPALLPVLRAGPTERPTPYSKARKVAGGIDKTLDEILQEPPIAEPESAAAASGSIPDPPSAAITG